MRKLVLPCLMMSASMSGSASARGPIGYAGLFADPYRIEWCVFQSQPFSMIDLWVWCLPSENGLMGVEFSISYPSNVTEVETEFNPDVLIPIVYDPVQLWFGSCHTDWIWVIRQSIMITSLEASILEIIPFTVTDESWFYTCPEGNPPAEMSAFAKMYINPPDESICWVGTGQKWSWGAIKSIYSE